ncbi:MAG: diguanylate cyclase, partial [Acidobacteria bacterium]|nr:diguanylate cyclase [Acidobacteriota bacterium]
MTPHAHILVVDDDVTTRILIRTALSSAGFGVTLAAGGREGLEAYRSGTFDLVMLDVDMPDMNGYEVCTALRAEAGALLPIVMVTGMDDVQSVGRAYDSGATDFIAKPVNPALIPHRVRYLLRGYQSLRDLRAADARNAAVLNAIPDMLLEVGLDGDLFSCHVPAFHRLAGSAAPCDGRHLSDLLTPAAVTACREAMEVALRQGSSSGIQYVVQQGSESAWFELSVAGKAVDAGDRPRFIVLSRDITDRKASEARIAKLAYVDSLTGLPNRHAFLERVDREIGRAGRTNRQMAVLFMDLDGFKTVNDTLGHGAGDLILQWAAERLRAGLRPADVLSRPLAAAGGEVELARLGGDEFTALILDIVHVEDALAVARRIGHMMRRPFTLDDRTVTLTTSIGVALYPDDGRDAATLLKHADTAMYHAKNSGRDNAQMYSVSLTEQAVQRLELDASLRVALEREEFFLVYQPQYDVASHTIRSVEALVRWNHPRR